MFRFFSKWIQYALVSGLIMVAGCTEPVDPGDDPIDVVTPVTGTLEIEFRVPGSWLPPSRVVRADLSIATSAENLYKGHFYQVANVYNSKLVYQFDIPPGNYYYQAGIVCLAEGDSCSAANYPGGRYGMKWAIGTATVLEDQTIHVVPQFTN